MSICVVTAALSALALAAGCLGSSAAGASGPSADWTNPQHVGAGSDLAWLEMAPDGYAMTDAWTPTPDGCPAPCYVPSSEHRARQPGGSWAHASFPSDRVDRPYGGPRPRATDVAFDAASNGWALWFLPGASMSGDWMLAYRPRGGDWTDMGMLPADLGQTTPHLAVPESGPPAVWQNVSNAAGVTELRVATWTGGGWVTTRSADRFASLTAGPNGTFRAAWPSDGGHRVTVSDLEPDGTWTPETTTAQLTDAAVTDSIWLGPHALLLYTWSNQTITTSVIGEWPGGGWDPRATEIGSSARWGIGGPRQLATLVWSAGSRVIALQQLPSGGWSPAVSVGTGVNPEVTVDARGNGTVAWVGTGPSPATYYAHRPVNGVWTAARRLPAPVASPGDPSGRVLVAVDRAGTVTVGGRGTLRGVTGLHTADLHTPAAVTTVDRAPSAGWASAATFEVGWQTTWLAATSHDVRYRERRVTNARSSLRRLLTGTKGSASKLRGKDGRTYCVSARAHAGRTTGPWGEETCVATPLDDRVLTAGKTWTRVGGTSRSRTRDATLTSPPIHGSRFALLVAPSAGAGRVKVSFGGRTLGTYRLTKGHRDRPRVIDLGGFKHTRHGKLVITVVSSGRPVRIDGVYAR